MTNKKKILLIDDDGTLRTLYSGVLEVAGFEVEQIVEGKAGLERLKQGNYDLALMDILLPEKEGTEILNQLQNQPSIPSHGPIVILTNQDRKEVLDRCLELGAAGVIIKSSITPDELLKKVKKYLDSE